MEIHLEYHLRDEKPQISQWVEKVIAKCSKRLKFKHARINIHSSYGWEENGSSGYCPSDSEIEISIDLTSPNLKFETLGFTLAISFIV